MHPKKILKNQAPGTVTYTGNYTDVPLKMDLYCYTPEDWSKKTIQSIAEIQDDDSIKWLNITGLSHIAVIHTIGERFGVAPLILEDIVNVSQYSKMQVEEGLFFSVWKMIYKKQEAIEHEHISILLMDHLVITFQENEGDVFETVRYRLEKNKGILRTQGADYLTFALIDAIVDQYYETLNLVNRSFDEYEASTLESHRFNLESLYPLRKELTKLKSAVLPMKSAFTRFLHQKPAIISESVLPYYLDVYENILQLSEQITTVRELVTSLHETQLSELSDKMNRIMTTLTIFSAVFIPLSFLAGVFGMNFQRLPGLSQPNAFRIFILTCFVIAGTMLTFFKRKNWF